MSHTKTNKNEKKKINIKSFHSRKNLSPIEMPFYASFMKASYTIEAAIVMPLFITVMVFGIFLFRVLQVQSGVQHAIDSASRTMAVTLGDVAQDEGEENQDLDDVGLLAATIALSDAEILAKSVPVSYVDGGILGFNYLESSVTGNYIDVKVSYNMTMPVGLLGDFTFPVTQRSKNRKWVGYDPSENAWDGKYVYITEHGEVYHTDINCTYLYPSVHRIAESELDSARNKSGGKYYKCKKCGKVASSGYLYITDYGTAYHNDITCTEIRHNVSKVLYESVKDTMDGCSKCSSGISDDED